MLRTIDPVPSLFWLQLAVCIVLPERVLFLARKTVKTWCISQCVIASAARPGNVCAEAVETNLRRNNFSTTIMHRVKKHYCKPFFPRPRYYDHYPCGRNMQGGVAFLCLVMFDADFSVRNRTQITKITTFFLCVAVTIFPIAHHTPLQVSMTMKEKSNWNFNNKT